VWMFIHNIQGAYDGAAHAANNHYAPINTTVGPSVGRCVWLTGFVVDESSIGLITWD